MAVPRLPDQRPFIRLDPGRLEVPPRRAASIAGSARAGRRPGRGRAGTRGPGGLGRRGRQPRRRPGRHGGGLSDLEFRVAGRAGLLGTDTVAATTVHPLQVLEEALPETGHGVRLDLIVAIPTLAARAPPRPYN